MENSKKNITFYKIVRILTVAPIICLITSLLLFFNNRSLYGSTLSFILSLIFLVVVPLLSYPVFYIVKPFRLKGRPFQRKLAIVFSYCSYIFVVIFSLIFHDSLQIIFYHLNYFLTATLIFLSTKFLHFNASGHAAGVAGPITFLSLFVSPWYAFGYLLLILVIYCSIKMKRHTILETIIGSLIPTIIGIVCFIIFICVM